MDFEQAIDWLDGMVGRELTMIITPANDLGRTTAATSGTLRRGELDRPVVPPEIMLPDEPERVWFRIELEGGGRAMDLYLARAWFTSARTAGRAGLEIQSGDIALMFAILTRPSRHH